MTAMKRKERIPERTCIVCRRRFSKYDLDRIALVRGLFVWDPGQCAGGRGAYVCRDDSCKEKFAKRQSDFLQRAFRRKVLKERWETHGFYLSPQGQ